MLILPIKNIQTRRIAIIAAHVFLEGAHRGQHDAQRVGGAAGPAGRANLPEAPEQKSSAGRGVGVCQGEQTMIDRYMDGRMNACKNGQTAG